MDKRFEQACHQKNIWVANKPMKRYLALHHYGMQMKTPLDTHPLIKLKLKGLSTLRTGEDVDCRDAHKALLRQVGM